jgi:hypothetical protein
MQRDSDTPYLGGVTRASGRIAVRASMLSD